MWPCEICGYNSLILSTIYRKRHCPTLKGWVMDSMIKACRECYWKFKEEEDERY